MRSGKLLLLLSVSFIIIVSGCVSQEVKDLPSRESAIPSDAVKMTPETDQSPPILHSDEYETPVPLEAINTAGAEDSPFVPDDMSGIYFFFTPDVRVPVEKQLLDGVTGIYFSEYSGGQWQPPVRVILQDPGKLSLEGCEFVSGNYMLFCSAREGLTGVNWFSASYRDGSWKDWKLVEFPEGYEVGELHMWGNELYYHSSRPGGKGGLDIWMIERQPDGSWSEPVNVDAVNSQDDEGWPYITPDGKELWFNRQYLGTPGVFRSVRTGEGWSEPELIISQFAGEPTLDSQGNVYFVHHYYRDGEMIEADIYVAYRRS